MIGRKVNRKSPPWHTVTVLETASSLGSRSLSHLNQVIWADPFGKGRPDLLRSEFHISLCGKGGLIKRQLQPDPGEESLGDALHA